MLGGSLQRERSQVTRLAELEDAVSVTVIAQYPVVAAYQRVGRRSLAGRVVRLHSAWHQFPLFRVMQSWGNELPSEHAVLPPRVEKDVVSAILHDDVRIDGWVRIVEQQAGLSFHAAEVCDNSEKKVEKWLNHTLKASKQPQRVLLTTRQDIVSS